jgi:hypothetical protein
MSAGVEQFDEILDLNRADKWAHAAIAFRGCGVSLYRLDRMHHTAEAAHAKFIAALFALDNDELIAFNEYRKSLATA